MATKNIVPNADGEGQLGTSSKSWAQGHIDSITGTIATAAQANITSLGTLTSLTLSGNLVIPNDGTIGSVGTSGALTIKSGGSVCINASDPVKILDVRGQLAISNSSSSYYYIDRTDTDGNLFKL